MVPVEHESSYPPPPSRVQLERSHRADPDEDLDNRPGHRRAQSVPAEKLQVKVWLLCEDIINKRKRKHLNLRSLHIQENLGCVFKCVIA